jgi:hypothetical protein
VVEEQGAVRGSRGRAGRVREVDFGVDRVDGRAEEKSCATPRLDRQDREEGVHELPSPQTVVPPLLRVLNRYFCTVVTTTKDSGWL